MSKKRVIYIAGAMTKEKDFNHPAFFAKAAELEAQGWVVLNPATLPLFLRQEHYMDISAAMVRSATYMCMLDGWEKSEGATAEYAQARKLGHSIYNEKMMLILPNEYKLVAA